LIHTLLDPEQVAAWGWRVPFIGSVLFLVLGVLLRRGLQETAEGVQAAARRPPLIASLIADWRPMLQTFGIIAMTNAAYYLSFTYNGRSAQPGCGCRDLSVREHADTLRRVVRENRSVDGCPTTSARRRLMIALTLAMMILIVPALQLMRTGSLWQFAIGQVLMAVPVGHGARDAGARWWSRSSPPAHQRVTLDELCPTSVDSRTSRAAPRRSYPRAGRATGDSHSHPRGTIMAYGVIGLTLFMVDEGDQLACARRLSGDAAAELYVMATASKPEAEPEEGLALKKNAA
jgi:hypothetical protein